MLCWMKAWCACVFCFLFFAVIFPSFVFLKLGANDFFIRFCILLRVYVELLLLVHVFSIICIVQIQRRNHALDHAYRV